MYGMRRISLMQSIVFQSSDNFPISAKTYIGFSQKKKNFKKPRDICLV